MQMKAEGAKEIPDYIDTTQERWERELAAEKQRVLEDEKRRALEAEQAKMKLNQAEVILNLGAQPISVPYDPSRVVSGQAVNEWLKKIDEPSFEEQNESVTRRNDKINTFRLSYIEDYEEEEAKRLVEECLGFERPRVVGWQVAIKVYERPLEEKNRKIILAESAISGDKFVNAVGLVLSIAPLAFKGKYFEETLYMRLIRKVFGKFMKPSIYQPFCKVGDWVVFDRNAGPQMRFYDVPITFIEDKFIRCIVPDPSVITRC